MSDGKHTVRVPPITRVHNLYRLRFTVNEITQITPPTSVSFSRSLTEYQLSRYSKLRPRDRQGRRSRDHLAACTYLGLLKRKRLGGEFYYSPTPLGEKLTRYEFREECPKDFDENIVFTTAILKLRFTNAHYGHDHFKDYRYRPVVLILQALNVFPMRIEQLYFLLGKIRSESELSTSKGKKLLEQVFDPSYRSVQGAKLFAKKVKLTSEDLKELDRSIKPILTWCEQVGLLNDDSDGAYHITMKGRTVLSVAQDYEPIWFEDLGTNKERKAALLLLLLAALKERKRFSKSFLKSTPHLDSELELKHETNEKLLRALSKDYSCIGKKLDAISKDELFELDFYIDIPSEYQDTVSEYYEIGKKALGVVATLDDLHLSLYRHLHGTLISDSGEIERSRQSQLWSIALPRREIFKVQFEYDSCIALRLLRFNANKYQRQFENLVSPSLKNTAENNPDLLVINDIAYLIECKSAEEWNENLSFTKVVRREIVNYQDYCDGVKTNCALLLVESEFEKAEFYIQLQDTLRIKDKIVFCSFPYLVSCIKDENMRKHLAQVCNDPQMYPAEQKILMNKYHLLRSQSLPI